MSLEFDCLYDWRAFSMEKFPIYRARGPHRELGRAHGEQACEQIKRHLDILCASLKLTAQSLRDRAMKFQPLLQQYCPHLIGEIEGLAEGAKIAYAEALALNVRGALKQGGDGGCTAFVVSRRGTRTGEILIGQNSDQLPIARELGYVLYLQPQDKPEILMWTFGGMIGYHGINSLGIGHFANDLGGGPKPRFGMPHYFPKRLMHECRTMDELRQTLEKIPFWASGNYVLCDGNGEILDLEVTPEGVHSISDNGSGFISHSNHFLSACHATEENHKASAMDSFFRLKRINQLIHRHFGQLTVDDFKSFLRDRDNHPNGICRFAQTDHPDADWMTAGMTVASIIAEPDQRRLHIACGNRAESPFEVYEMD